MTHGEILDKVLAQLKKDGAINEWEWSEASEPSLKQMAVELKERIEPMFTKQHPQFMNILNRVDLSEKQYQNLKQMEGDFMLNVSKAMVLRELQKVLIKITYAGESLPPELPENWDKLWDN